LGALIEEPEFEEDTVLISFSFLGSAALFTFLEAFFAIFGYLSFYLIGFKSWEFGPGKK